MTHPLNARLRTLTFIALALAPAIDAQTKARPSSQAIVLKTSPSKAEVAAALEQVKTTVLPRCWSSKCDKKESQRKKYLKKWQAVVSDHYVVFTNGPTASCKKYGVTLETLYERMQKELPFDDPDNLLVAYIFKDKNDYYRFSTNLSGFSYKGARATAGHATSQFYATYYSSPRDKVVYHEAAHEIVGACLKVKGVGSWFQEGMAVYFEKKMTNGRLETCRSEIKRGKYYSLEEMFALNSLLSDPKGNGRRSYNHAGALINFMMHTKEKPVAGKFEKFLQAARTQGHGYMRGAKISTRLIRDVYGLSLQEFEQLWLKHLGIKPRS